MSNIRQLKTEKINKIWLFIIEKKIIKTIKATSAIKIIQR